ncbi:hypothetical protein QNI16_30135 [Cytophagaceae bacterium YF14B1]|uniref:Uncharacterized protein n=1 Tax=Xanthocytophaga flava TaxID=3048013 RepID=A0AAE3QWQ0_9BACT|nr:hypothetical protein [Xanthocytophaga flavus]MDJ1484798.1 hypothetical protein [Xanthocytophaga flavus]
MSRKLIFGIYPGGTSGTEAGLTVAKPDNAILVNDALAKLQDSLSLFLVRCYTSFGSTNKWTPANPLQYLNNGRKMDLVVGYQSKEGDIEGWINFIRNIINQYGRHMAKVQITEEPNLHNIPVVDGDYPRVREAVVEGVIAAKKVIRKRGLPIEVGFNAVPTFDPANDFWREIGRLATPAFYESLDYVGLDFFPDVFRPVALDELEEAVRFVLNHFRYISLAEANIPFVVPIHITENGWATSPERSAEKQAKVLECVIRAIHEYRIEMNVTHYELFGLRDADSQNPNIFHQFGIMQDDYSPKPAFAMYQKLIAELG